MIFSIDFYAEKLYYYVMKYSYNIKNIKIQSCGIKDCDENWHWNTGEDGFGDYDLWTVFRGHGALTCGGKRWDVSVGDSLLLTPGNRCIGEHDLDDKLLTINVHFDFIGEGRPIYPFSGGALYRRISDISYMRDALGRVLRYFNAGKKDIAEAVFSSVLAEFFEQQSVYIDNVYGKDKYDLVRGICDRINASPSSVPPLFELAKECGYSADYLGRVFSSVVGLPISEYIKNAKINLAKQQLSSTSMTIEEISRSLGYYDVCYFSRQFKAETGYSPSAHRKNKMM